MSFIEFVQKLETISPYLHPHEKDYLVNLKAKLSLGCTTAEAILIKESFDVLFETIRLRKEMKQQKEKERINQIDQLKEWLEDDSFHTVEKTAMINKLKDLERGGSL